MNEQTINWYPGHMTKTKRQMEKILPLIDIVAEIIDARIPVSSRNPDLTGIIKNKKRIILLNKCDIANAESTKAWMKHFSDGGDLALNVDCRSGTGLTAFLPVVKNALHDKTEANAKRGMTGKTLRVMVVGIPNTGKSTFINKMAGKTKAKTENRPGVTRGNQWFLIEKGVELLDTPGILWHKFDDPKTGEVLAFTGAIKDSVMDIEELALRFLDTVKTDYFDMLAARYKLSQSNVNMTAYELLNQIGKNRGMKISGGETDTLRTAQMLFEEFRNAKIGRITLEKVK